MFIVRKGFFKEFLNLSISFFFIILLITMKIPNKDDILGLPVETPLPLKLNILPIGGRPIFPGIFTPLMINSPEDIKVIE